MVQYIYIIVSVLSIVFYVLSVQFKEKKNILTVQMLSGICFFTVYLIKGLRGITGAWSGVSVEVLEWTKNLVFVKKIKKRQDISKLSLLVFLSLLVIVSIIFYDGIFSLIPLFINTLLFISTYKKNPKYIRYTMLICGLLWSCYNFYLGAYIILVGNFLEVVSAAISIYRFKDADKR